MRLLMVATGPPSHGGKGYQVRLYNQILLLAERHEITLLTFTGAADVDIRIVAACRKVVAIHRSPRQAAAAAALHAARLPLSVGLYVDRRMSAALASEVASGDYDLVHLQLVRLAPYLPQTAPLPVLIDMMDAAELNMRERARAAPPVIRHLLDIEAGRLGPYERAAAEKADLSLLISARDLSYIGSPPKARVLPNGVEPKIIEGIAPVRSPETMIFSGTMSYFPNADAATWFVTEILPLVSAAVPSSVFRIVGREPGPTITRFGSHPGITVTGAVPDVAQELARATVSVCPMRLGSGMQTKILEAMAVGTPIVGTSKALEGIPEDLHPFLVRADSAKEFAGQVELILTNPEPALKRAADGLATITRRHTWRQSIERLEAFYEETIAAASPADRR